MITPKRFLQYLLGSAAMIGFLCVSIGSVRAQATRTPEFQLELRSTDTVTYPHIRADTIPDTTINGQDFKNYIVRDTTYSIDTVTLGNAAPGEGGRAFGYDPMATDTFDADFGEDAAYPGGAFGPGIDLFFTRPDLSATRVDIRQKPTTDSFAISYTLGASFEHYPGSLLWNPSQIPDIIKGIWISFYEATTPLIDMKTTNIFTESNGSAFAGNLIVTLFYNMQPHYISPAAVNGPATNGGGLISNATVYPNPMPSGGALDITLSQAASLRVVGYDVAGREVLRISRGAMGGENILDLSSALANIHGAVMLHIEAASGTQNETKNVMLVRE